MPSEIRLVGLPPEAQTSPVFVSRHELTAQRIREGVYPASTFFNHDHSVLLLHEGAPTVVEQVVHHAPTAWTLGPGDVLIIPAGAPIAAKNTARVPSPPPPSAPPASTSTTRSPHLSTESAAAPHRSCPSPKTAALTSPTSSPSSSLRAPRPARRSSS